MKKTFEYIGLTVLFLFSYYYTDKISSMMSNKDTIMLTLEEIDNSLTKECIEGYITDEGVVLGVSGISVDMEESYQNMKGFGFKEELTVYKENTCVVNKNNSVDRYVIKGNPKKNSVSLILKINTSNYLESYVNISLANEVELSLIVNDNIYNNKKEYIESLNNKIDVLYNGNNINEFKNLRNSFHCIYTKENSMLKECEEEKLNTIKTDKYYTKNALSEIKKNIEKGDFIVLEENKVNLEEFNQIIKYILSKGIEIKNITNHL